MDKYRLLSLIGMFLFCLCAGQSLAQETDKLYNVVSITVNGAKEFDEKNIITASGLRNEMLVSLPDEQISTAIRKLWDTHLFDNVAVYAERIEGDDVYLVIEVQELPVISNIEFAGIPGSKGETIMKETGLAKGKRASDNLIITAKNYILSEDIKKGFLSSKVNMVAERDTTETNAVKLKIMVDKGERVRIANILFEGNDSLKANKLRGAMKNTKQIKKLNIFKPSKFVEDKYEEDLVSLVNAYKNEGYRDARIVSDTSIFNKAENTLDLKIKVSEGHKYHYRSINFVGNSKFQTEGLQEILGIKPGDVYNAELLAKRINQDQKNGRDISTLYMDNGYLFAQIVPVEVSTDNDSIDLEIRIFEGEKAYINRVNIKGNTRTFDHVIYRELTTRPGDLFSKTEIQRSMQKIGALGFFDPETMGIDPVPNPATNTVDINYTLVEKQSSQIELQGGWGGGQLIGTIGLSFNNFSVRNLFNKKAWKPLPMGDGQQLSIRAQASYGYQSYSFSFTEPWLGGRRPLSISASFYYTQQQEYNYYTNDRGAGILNIIGAGLNLAKRLKWPDDYFVLSGGIGYSNYNWKDYYWGPYYNFDTGISHNLNLNVSLSRKSSGPNPIYPMSGSDFLLSAQVTPPYSLFNNTDYNNLSDVERFKWLEYYKIKFKGTWYTNIFAKLVLLTHAEMGYLGSYNSAVGLGPFERFQMGGSGMVQYRYYGSEVISLRGYKDNSIASSTKALSQGDPIYNKFTVELRYPITLQPNTSVYMLAFAEGGNTYADFKSYNPFDLHRSVGAGIRLFMPMFGMIGFDLGYGFDPMPGQEKKWEFHFTLGQNLF